MPRQVFKNRAIAAAGPLPDQPTVDNLRRWTSFRKGTFTDDFDQGATHLLCTQEQFNKRAPRGTLTDTTCTLTETYNQSSSQRCIEAWETFPHCSL